MKFFATSRLSENIAETPEGFLICLGVAIARTGEMVYAAEELPILDADEEGKILIIRSPDDLFDAKTMASFEGKAVTISHPNNFISPTNWGTLAKGIIQNVRRGKGEASNDLIADLLITDSVAINLVKSGLRETSCGYEASYVQVGPGRGRQGNIVGNHLALVQQGRAGSSYAINDHKGKESEMEWSDLFKSPKVAKAIKEAMKTEDAANVETPETKKGFVSYDDFMKGMDALGEKLMGAMGKKSGDASTQPTESEPAKIVAKDDDVANGLEERMKKLEVAVAQILEKLSAGTGDEDGDDEVTDEDGDDDEETGDEESCDEDEDGELVGDEDVPSKSKTGDSASRIEILAPGMDPKTRDAKRKALVACYATKDGKAAIEGFTNGKKPNFRDEKTVSTLFRGVSEVLKSSRNNDFAKTKTYDFKSQMGVPEGAITPEALNEKNAKFWADRKAN